MPTPTHEWFNRLVSRHIETQLESFTTRDDDAGRFASLIASGGSSRMFLKKGPKKTDVVRRQPDDQFQHEDAKYPGVVIEVSFSQRGKELRRLAQDYILYSNGAIRLVIGIDIKSHQESTIASWRPRLTSIADDIVVLEAVSDLECRAFRSPSGKALNINDSLEFDLRSFAPDEITCGNEPVKLQLPFPLLAQFLSRAEKVQRKRESPDEQKGIEPSLQTLKRRFSSSSLEELSSFDERKFEEVERRSSIQIEEEDQDFVLPVMKRKR